MDTRSEIGSLKEEIAEIKARNKRVEADKAWETSLIRRIFIAVSTYILIAIFMLSIGVEKPLLSAIIPALAYFISTASLGILKSWWLKRRK